MPDVRSPLIDLSDTAVRDAIKRAKARGYITHVQVNAIVPGKD